MKRLIRGLSFILVYVLVFCSCSEFNAEKVKEIREKTEKYVVKFNLLKKRNELPETFDFYRYYEKTQDITYIKTGNEFTIGYRISKVNSIFYDSITDKWLNYQDCLVLKDGICIKWKTIFD